MKKLSFIYTHTHNDIQLLGSLWRGLKPKPCFSKLTHCKYLYLEMLMGRSCYVRDLLYSFDSFCLRLIHFFFFPTPPSCWTSFASYCFSINPAKQNQFMFILTSCTTPQITSIDVSRLKWLFELQNCVFIPVPSTGTAYCTKQHERFRQAREQGNSWRKRKGL